ncbi:MAG: hypothetical protein U9N87_10305, partial [Planctomycetota bacterium]|nr:hypothetical protein [Planctomycetota bacterium]
MSEPDSPESRIDVTAELLVLGNQGSAATLSVPYVGKLRFFPNRVELAHEPSVRVEVAPGEFHTYRIVAEKGKMTLHVDGRKVLSSDKADSRTVHTDWSSIVCSPYGFTFGNEPLFVTKSEYSAARFRNTLDQWEKGYAEQVAQMSKRDAIPPVMALGMAVSADQITPRVTGHSIWRRVESRLEDPKMGVRTQSWVADRDDFPDQYQLDRVLEVEASIGGGDQGYSGWAQLRGGRIVRVIYYEDPAVPQ